MSERINKARYWTGVLYPENMIQGWEEKIADIVQVPFAYALHSADIDKKSEHRKDHIHLILVFPNTTTYKHALSVFKLLNAHDRNAINKCEAVINIRHCYDYLIHDTDNAKKQGKHLYSPEDRVTGNLFDIGAYEQISSAEKHQMLKELCDYIMEFKICNLADFYIAASQNFDASYFEVITGYNAFLDRLTRGNYLKYESQNSNTATRQQHVATCEKDMLRCPVCGSLDFKKQGKTPAGTQRFACKDCGSTWVER